MTFTSKLANKGLGTFKAVTPTGTAFGVKPSDDLTIDQAHLLKEMGEHPSLFAYYAKLFAKAKALAKKARYDRHCLEEELTAQFRVKHPQGGRGGVSEATIKLMVQRDVKMRLAHQKVMSAQERADTLEALKEAFAIRTFMLQSINSTNNKDVFNEKPITKSLPTPKKQ